MTTRRLAIAAGLLAAMASLPARHLDAQAPAALVSDVRTGFGGFAWGTTLEQIAAARGRPAVDTMAKDYRGWSIATR